MDRTLERCRDLDSRLVLAAKDIKILSRLSWPVRAQKAFLDAWAAGRPALPEAPALRLDHGEELAALRALRRECDRSHPVERYLDDTAASYETAAAMLQSAGTPAFTELSCALYGRPGDAIGRSGVTNLGAAGHFLRATDGLAGGYLAAKEEFCLTPEHVAREIEREVRAFFTGHPVQVVIDPDLAPKAAAGARTVRLRGATCFGPHDIGQLLQHEVFVHTATMRNGREQPHLKTLGLGAPRTTATQEGLATLAELVTSTMDLDRLRRIALRIEAVERALEGADFLDIFRFFLDAGQHEEESYHGAMRVFRGGDVRGRIAFTKDVVYLQGLIFTHTFLRKAIQEDRPECSRWLFAGRLALGDVLALEPFFVSGFIAPPLYEPRWVADRRVLAASLLYSVFANTISLGSIRLADFANA